MVFSCSTKRVASYINVFIQLLHYTAEYRFLVKYLSRLTKCIYRTTPLTYFNNFVDETKREETEVGKAETEDNELAKCEIFLTMQYKVFLSI